MHAQSLPIVAWETLQNATGQLLLVAFNLRRTRYFLRKWWYGCICVLQKLRADSFLRICRDLTVPVILGSDTISHTKIVIDLANRGSYLAEGDTFFSLSSPSPQEFAHRVKASTPPKFYDGRVHQRHLPKF